MNDVSSIYKVTNKITGKAYVGFTRNTPTGRLTGHIQESKVTGYRFHNAIKKYGVDNFSLEVLYQSWDEDHTLNIMEPFFIKEYDTLQTGYNMTPGGDRGPVLIGSDNGMYDKRHTTASLLKMSTNRRGKCVGAGNMKRYHFEICKELG